MITLAKRLERTRQQIVDDIIANQRRRRAADNPVEWLRTWGEERALIADYNAVMGDIDKRQNAPE